MFFACTRTPSDRCFQLDSDLRLIVFPVFARGEEWINTASKWGGGGSAAQLSCDQCFFFILPAVLDDKG